MVAPASTGAALAAAPRPTPLRIVTTDAHSRARRGALATGHGVVDTPAFMPVGTQGTVKGLLPTQIEATGARIVLANAYHLSLRPGVEVVEAMGGIQRFMGWSGAVLTDSGGYQIMSLASLRKVTDEGVAFRSHLDGARLSLTPEEVVERQRRLGVDIMMPLDECVAAATERPAVEVALRRTTGWAERSARVAIGAQQLLFGIVQGGLVSDLRRMHAAQLAALEFPGYAVGGLSVGEEREVTREVAAETAAALPVERPRYLMGVGLPQDLLRFIAMGYDLFDCVLPTRNGRNGTCFTSAGRVNLRLARWARAAEPLDAACACYVCQTFSKAYLRHLHVAGEMLGAQLASLHNVHFYVDLMAQAREHLTAGDFAGWAAARADALDASEAA